MLLHFIKIIQSLQNRIAANSLEFIFLGEMSKIRYLDASTGQTQKRTGNDIASPFATLGMAIAGKNLALIDRSIKKSRCADH